METLLNVRQACEKLQICRDTLYRHIRAGKIPSYTLGRRVYFKESEIEGCLHRRDFTTFNNQ